MRWSGRGPREHHPKADATGEEPRTAEQLAANIISAPHSHSCEAVTSYVAHLRGLGPTPRHVRKGLSMWLHNVGRDFWDYQKPWESDDCVQEQHLCTCASVVRPLSVRRT